MNLTQKIVCYQNGRWTLSALLQDIRSILNSWLIEDFHWKQEDADDFFELVRPKIIRHIKSFQFTNTSFSHYLRKMLRLQIHSYQSKQIHERRKQDQLTSHISRNYFPVVNGIHRQYETRDNIWPESQTPENELFKNEIYSKALHDSHDFNNDPSPRNMPAEHKHLLLYSLKQAYNWDDGVISHLSRKTGISATRILGYRQELFSTIEKKLARRHKLQDINTKRYLKISFSCSDDTDQQQRYDRFRKKSYKLSRCSIAPTHKDISMCTGIPKGTVDSNLHNSAKKRLKRTL